LCKQSFKPVLGAALQMHQTRIAKKLSKGKLLLVWMAAWLLPGLVWAQNPGISTSKPLLGPGQSFTVTLTSGEDISSPPTFPEIAGMPKQGTSTSSSTTIINGQISSTYSITQRYLARAEGTYMLAPFAIQVAKKAFKYAGTKIIVKKGAGEDAETANGYDPFEEFFGSRRAAAYKSVKEDAFLGLDTDKDQVYVGEALTLTLSLYVADENRADMDFYDLNGQLSDLTKRIRPANCWEENFGITDIEPTTVTINGKRYTEYRIWQSAFYPLTEKDIVLPKVGLKMVKYEMATDPFFGGLDRKQTYTQFYTKPLSIPVRAVPPSPYGRELPVGDYKLEEHISRPKVRTGESVSYQFIIKGEGNISAINFKNPVHISQMDIYPPAITQNIVRQNGRVSGSKSYMFLLQPTEAGTYPLGKNGFVFPFFNPKKQQYDSLISRIAVISTGLSVERKTTSDESDYLSNTLLYLDESEGLKVLGNMVVLLLAAAMGVGLIWRGKKNR